MNCVKIVCYHKEAISICSPFNRVSLCFWAAAVDIWFVQKNPPAFWLVFNRFFNFNIARRKKSTQNWFIFVDNFTKFDKVSVVFSPAVKLRACLKLQTTVKWLDVNSMNCQTWILSDGFYNIGFSLFSGFYLQMNKFVLNEGNIDESFLQLLSLAFSP